MRQFDATLDAVKRNHPELTEAQQRVLAQDLEAERDAEQARAAKFQDHLDYDRREGNGR
jgi:hypothetical protein